MEDTHEEVYVSQSLGGSDDEHGCFDVPADYRVEQRSGLYVPLRG